jgi:hypothetical protein
MGATDYLANSQSGIKTLLENDTELGGYAATPYSYCDELMRVKKNYPGISIEVHTVNDGEWNVCSPDKIVDIYIRIYTAYTTETSSNTANLNMAGRVIEILETESNWSTITGCYRIDLEVDLEYETAISNQGKISRASEILASVYLRT